MKHNLQHSLGVAGLAACLLAAAPAARAQSVIFPQAQQAGTAAAAEEGDTYTLSNSLLAAKFVKQDGTLRFGGCEAMNLKPGTELFRIVLGDGTSLNASQMTLTRVGLKDLVPDDKAAKASLRLPGKALEAVFTHDGITVTWRAVLRDGSHYLRTEMDVTTDKDRKFTALYPMLYDVDTKTARTAPVVVGNTRGAILASNKIFAGLETPMGINSVKNATDLSGFKSTSWSPTSFTWTPGDDTPQGILDLGYQATQIVGTRGYVTFTEGGKVTVSFKYTSGSHRLNMAGVDITDGTGKVIAHDYHKGFTGNDTQKNEYTFNIKERGSYIVRYFVDTTETITSSGIISYNQRIKTPVVVFDLVPGETAQGK